MAGSRNHREKGRVKSCGGGGVGEKFRETGAGTKL